jgi:hypothetical protein
MMHSRVSSYFILRGSSENIILAFLIVSDKIVLLKSLILVSLSFYMFWRITTLKKSYFDIFVIYIVIITNWNIWTMCLIDSSTFLKIKME